MRWYLFGQRKPDYGAPTLATHFISFCNNCKEYVSHKVEAL